MKNDVKRKIGNAWYLRAMYAEEKIVSHAMKSLRLVKRRRMLCLCR